MIEIPEALTLSTQINNAISGKQIINVVAEHTPHKFAWFYGDPQKYSDKLVGKTIRKSCSWGGMVEIKVDDAKIIICDGVAFRYLKPGTKPPSKHQLLLELEDSSLITASVQMYGGMWCFKEDEKYENPYFWGAREKPLVLSNDFSEGYFDQLMSSESVQKLSTKAFLATDQRIPGLGNGVLQDILWKTKIHPKRKISSLKDNEKETLFFNVKDVISDMIKAGGRDTEKDLFGNYGGYKTMMSKKNIGNPCIACGGTIKKENYLGGSIYYCENCQSLQF